MKDVWNSSYKSNQGNVGLGQAIGYYTSIGASVLIPLNDTQKYDICVDVDGEIKRVSVKTTQGTNKSKIEEKYVVQLGNTGGSSGKSVIRKFDNTTCDILFVLTKSGDMYEIPAHLITKGRCLTLGKEWDSYKVKITF